MGWGWIALAWFIAWYFQLLLFSRPVVSDSLQPHGLQHTRPSVPHYLLEFAQVQVHCIGDAIQPSHPPTPCFTVQFSCSIMSDSLWPHGLQHTRLHCPSPTPRAYSNSCSSHWWCHPTILSCVVPFSSHLQSFPASGSFPMCQFFASGGQSIGVSASASVLPVNIQDWFPLGWTGWILLQSKGLSRVFSNTTVQKHQFFSTQLSF